MHPTVEEQLRAMGRALDELVATEAALSPGATETLRAIASQLRRLEASLPERLPFLRWDNEASAALLDELAGLLPAQPADGDAQPADGDAQQHDLPLGETEGDEHERNKALRARLARAVHELADTEAGDAASARLAEHARARLARDPSLNRPRRTVTP